MNLHERAIACKIIVHAFTAELSQSLQPLFALLNSNRIKKTHDVIHPIFYFITQTRFFFRYASQFLHARQTHATVRPLTWLDYLARPSYRTPNSLSRLTLSSLSSPANVKNEENRRPLYHVSYSDRNCCTSSPYTSSLYPCGLRSASFIVLKLSHIMFSLFLSYVSFYFSSLSCCFSCAMILLCLYQKCSFLRSHTRCS